MTGRKGMMGIQKRPGGFPADAVWRAGCVGSYPTRTAFDFLT